LERDLSRGDIWELSLERSLARRARNERRPPPPDRSTGRFARPPAAPPDPRDLADPELWQLSRARSRRRHTAPDPTFELPARSASIAALLLVTGGSVTAIASSLGGGARAHAAHAATADKRVPDLLPTAIERPLAEPASGGPDRAKPRSNGAVRTVAVPKAPKAPRSPAGVEELQRALGVPVDGEFGPATARALERWQRRHRLKPDGVAGPQTRAALDLGSGPVLRWTGRRHAPSHSHSHTRASRPKVVAARAGGGVRALQLALGVPADGVFGPATERALERWQRRHGLAPDGVAGPQTRAVLKLGPGAVLKRKASAHRRNSSGGGSNGGGSSTVVARVVAAANAIAGKPYVYGGGHGSFESEGYDCSGSVSYALHGGGLLSAPLSSSGFMSYGAAGPGSHITIYANPGHVYMTIDGRRFDTSARYETGSRWTGTGRSPAGYVVRHPPGY
jgi:peptidoglycan hydrolase-like protein with peptidoglycan-binding domain